MRLSRRIAALIVAAMIGAPAAAAAQTATVPRGGADLSTTPPVPLPETPPEAPGPGGNGSGDQAAAVAGSALPSTGSDPRVLFLCGVALTLLGVGLRLRTADADLY